MSDLPENDDQPLAMPRGNASRLRWLLFLATLLFVLGIFLPMITISKFIIISNSFSVVSGVLELLRNGQVLLFIVAAGFSIVLPIMKIMVLFKLLSKKAINSPKTKRHLHLMHEYGRCHARRNGHGGVNRDCQTWRYSQHQGSFWLIRVWCFSVTDNDHYQQSGAPNK